MAAFGEAWACELFFVDTLLVVDGWSDGMGGYSDNIFRCVLSNPPELHTHAHPYTHKYTHIHIRARHAYTQAHTHKQMHTFAHAYTRTPPPPPPPQGCLVDFSRQLSSLGPSSGVNVVISLLQRVDSPELKIPLYEYLLGTTDNRNNNHNHHDQNHNHNHDHDDTPGPFGSRPAHWRRSLRGCRLLAALPRPMQVGGGG